MKRGTTNLAVDALAYVSVLGLTATGLLIRWILPPGSGYRYSVWGLTRHDWGDVHLYFVIAFATLVLVHIVLHWSWICVAIGRLFSPSPQGTRRRMRYAVAFSALTILLPAAFLLAARSNVMPDSRDHVRPGNPGSRAGPGGKSARETPPAVTQPTEDGVAAPNAREERPRRQPRRTSSKDPLTRGTDAPAPSTCSGSKHASTNVTASRSFRRR